MRNEEKLSLSLVRGCGKALPSKIIAACGSVWEETVDPKVSMCKGTEGDVGHLRKDTYHWCKLSEHL